MRARMVRVTAAAGVLVLLGGGVAAYAGRGDDPAARYRIVDATTGDVTQTLATSGTVDASGRSDVAVAVDGTVDQVRVRVGQRVRAGQVLLTLDRSSLRAALAQAEAALARARAQLEADETAQAEAVDAASNQSASAASQSSPSSQPSQPSAATEPDGSAQELQDALAALHAEQDAVTAGQSAVSDALATAQAALATQASVCADAFGADDPTTDPTTDPSADPTADPTADPSTDPEPTADDAACTTALAAVQTAQQDVADAEDSLAEALGTLGSTLGQAVALLQQAAQEPTQQPSQQPTQEPTQQPTQEPTTQDQPTDTSTPTAARLAADQAEIDGAKADVVEAQSQLDQAVVVAPTAGRVVRLDAAPGDRVAAGDEAAVVVSGSSAVVIASIDETEIREIKRGQKVRVSVPGSTGSTVGTVTGIGLTADTSSGTAAYPVTVSVPHPAVALPTGSTAELAIVIDRAHGVVTVPASAVSGTGATAMVRVLAGGVLTPTPVTIGLVGARTVEITQGLEAGATIVLADLTQEVSGAGTSLGGELTFMGPIGRAPVMSGGGPAVTKGH